MKEEIIKYAIIGILIISLFIFIGFGMFTSAESDDTSSSSSSSSASSGENTTQLEGMNLYNADGTVNEGAISELQKYFENNYLGDSDGYFERAGHGRGNVGSYNKNSRTYASWWDDSTYNAHEKFQCTWWARGRANQYLESIGKEKISWRTGDGKDVLNNLKAKGYETGTEPRANSLICWGASGSNPHGHIAYVEAVDKDGTIYFSEAGGGRSWYGITKREKGNYDYAGMPFQGFVYLSDEDTTINKSTESDITRLVNAHNKLPEDTYGPNAGDPSNLTSVEGEKINSEAAAQYNKMKSAAAADGVTLNICSGYRTYAKQNSKYQNANVNVETTASYYQGPLSSEHRTGLAIDFGHVQTNVTGNWDTWLTNASYSKKHTAMFNWLYAHAHEYGFILRYPLGSEKITGINAESWHYRYIGITDAKAFKEKSKGYELTRKGITYSTYTYEQYHQEVFGTGNYGYEYTVDENYKNQFGL